MKKNRRTRKKKNAEQEIRKNAEEKNIKIKE